MPSEPGKFGADEQRLYEKATQQADKAFRMAMYAAGYKRSTVTKPGTDRAVVMRGEPMMMTRGTSTASQCVELGTKIVREFNRHPGARQRRRPGAPRTLSAAEMKD